MAALPPTRLSGAWSTRAVAVTWADGSVPEQRVDREPAAVAAGVAVPRRQVVADLGGQLADAHRLEPHPARPGQRGDEEPVAPEHLVLDTRNGPDGEIHALGECAHVARVDPERHAGLEVVGEHLTGQLQPRLTLAGQVLEEEAHAPEECAPKLLLHGDGCLDPLRAAQKARPVDEVG